MDFLKTTHSQISPLFQSVGSTKRNILIVVVLMIIGGAAWYINGDWNDQQVFLYGGRDFSPAEIGSMETALGRAGIEDYDVIDNRIQIRQSQRAEILKVIDDADSVPKCISGYEPADSGFSPFMTGAQQRNLEKSKKQNRICAMIREIKGISDVMVEYDETRSSGFPRTTERTAAVSVRPDGQRHLEGYEVETIRSMVQRGVAGLKPADIVVIDGNSGIAHHWQGDRQVDPAEVLRKDYASAKQHYEGIWKQKIENALKGYPDAQVNVQIQLEQIVRLKPTRSAHQARLVDSRQTKTLRIAAIDQSPTNIERTQRSVPRSVPRAVAHFRNPMPGSNGQARIQYFSVNQNAADQNEIEFTSTSPPASAVTTSPTQPTAVQPASLVTEESDYVPQSASVSISVPEEWIRKLARQRKATLDAARTNTQTTQDESQNTANTETTPADQPELTPADIQQCFAKVRQDIMHRVTPLLPGTRQQADASHLIAVSLDPAIASVETGTPEQAGLSSWMQLASKVDFEQLKTNWYTWTIPLVAVFGLALMWLSNRAQTNADRERRQQQLALQATADTQRPAQPTDQPADRQRQEIEHNDLEPSEQEAKLTTDIDRAFENDHQANLSKEVVEMIQNDPETTIKVFRTWLTETT